jgi:pimeloyl-ACP methyl ester carboxylesterase
LACPFNPINAKPIEIDYSHRRSPPAETLEMRSVLLVVTLCCGFGLAAPQQSPYEITIPANPPYYRVRYEANSEPAKLAFSVSYTVWIPEQVATLRGVIVHQHGCGEGSCKSGQTGSFDLHWQALARKHQCALLSPVYEQPQTADCQLWCDPRNGSDVAFQQALSDLGQQSKHPELATVPWALWGHSGGGTWSGGMTLLHPERVVAAWLRSGVPPLKPTEAKPIPYSISPALLRVPIMCNLGTKEGVSVKDGPYSKVWENNQNFFSELRRQHALVAVAIDPISSHECGNQRYLAIPWLDACLSARLPKRLGDELQSMAESSVWLAELRAEEAAKSLPVPASEFRGAVDDSIWLPNAAIAAAWKQYITDTTVSDTTPPPAPFQIKVTGNVITWQAEADLESGLASFVILRDGQKIGQVPEEGKNPRGRPIFQNNSYSDTPTQPLVSMQYVDATAQPNQRYEYKVIAVNTVGLESP